MLLIPDNSTLRAFIPNTLASAMGERPLYEKIYPFIVSAEQWFMQSFISRGILEELVRDATDENEPLYFLPRRIVVLRAWINAIPSIDVIIGPTGVGVTETASLKPASKAKMDALMTASKRELDYNIEELVNIIWRIPGWLDSKQADNFRISLFPDFSILDALEIYDNRFEQWKALAHRASIIERRIAHEWVSVPVMSRLRSLSLARQDKGAISDVVSLIRSAVIEELRTGFEQKESIEDVTNIIRSDRTNFADWHSSETAARFKDYGFKNCKKDSAYFL